MSTATVIRAGWWHDYVCPTHGTELSAPVAEGYPCPHGCLLTGEPYAAAWAVLDHQARARRLRLAARRYRRTGDAADREQALGLVAACAEFYAEAAAAGWNDQARPWMLRGKLFAQALTEALWTVQVADGVRVLAADPVARRELDDSVAELLRELSATAGQARTRLVDEQGDLRSNYTAWLDAAVGAASRALRALGVAADPQPAVDHAFEHVRAAVGDDGWEWEGATYYHVFVLRAHLLNLAGTDPSAVPADVAGRLAAMVRVLTSLATPDGRLPVLHDGPFQRDGALLELIEVCVLAAQFWTATGLDAVERYARAALDEPHDGLEDLLDGWFAGPPLPALAAGRGSVRFPDVGYLVLRDPDDTWQAVVDAGPHGGSHGHLDKLSLYLFGSSEAWQPAPGVPPYGSDLRRDYYSRTQAHPTVRIDGTDQQQCAGAVLAWEPGPPARAVVAADDAYPGVTLRREVTMAGEYLLDVVWARSEQDHDIELGLRPGGGLEVVAQVGGWRSRWTAGPRALHGLHAGTGPSLLRVRPGRGPSDRPAVARTVADWSARTAGIAFISVYWPGAVDQVLGLELIPGGVRVLLPDGRAADHFLEAIG